MNSTLNVVIVDDSSIIRQWLVALLGKIENVEVTGQAGDVGEAIAMLRARHPDVVILDIGLPDGNGFDVLQAMRQEGITSVVMMLTNSVDPQYRQRALQWGVRYFFDKSSEFQKVRETLRNLAIADIDQGEHPQ